MTFAIRLLLSLLLSLLMLSLLLLLFLSLLLLLVVVVVVVIVNQKNYKLCPLRFSARRLSDPERFLSAESLERVLSPPSRLQMQKTLERLVEELPVEGHNGDLTSARASSVLEMAEKNERESSHDLQEARHGQGTEDEVVQHWTKPAPSHNALRRSSISYSPIKEVKDGVPMDSVSQGNHSLRRVAKCHKHVLLPETSSEYCCS